MKLLASTVAALLMLASLPAAWAETPTTVFLEERTWSELRDRAASRSVIVIEQVGGTEQNGHHMTLGKHNDRVKILSEKIARTLGNGLVAPVIAYVPEGKLTPPSGHMRFPGTITVPDETFRQVLEYAARSFKLHGVKDIVFLGDHGSTQADQRTVGARLK